MKIRESFMNIRVEKKDLPPQLDLLIAAKLIHLVADVVFEALDVLFICAAVDEVEEEARSRFYPHFGFLNTHGHHMDGDVLALHAAKVRVFRWTAMEYSKL